MPKLLKQFFSFDKLMKDPLVAAFFILSCVLIIFGSLQIFGVAFELMDMSFFSGLKMVLTTLFMLVFSFVSLRLACELMIAVFHINNNLSPDGGKSETADIDLMDSTRAAASKVAKSASAATKSAYDSTRSSSSESGNDDAAQSDVENVTSDKPKT